MVTVTGTNGKGSTCAMLEAMLRCAGHRTGLYASPHLMRYNERVRIAGEAQGDDALVAAFNAVEDARGDVPLTYFEYGTLAALWVFARAGLDVMILEVGLGGRLDAVNVVDADVAVVTSIDLDHMDYLGPTREDIGREKAGIFRPGRPAICAEPDPPASLLDARRAAGARSIRDRPRFRLRRRRSAVAVLGSRTADRHGLPYPALRGAYQLANAATALAVLDVLRDRLHVAAGAVRDGLVAVELPGRFQVLPGRPAIVLDVAHNPHAAQRIGRDARRDGLFPGDDRRVRHARRQGHRRRRRRDALAGRPLVRRDAARAARRECGGASHRIGAGGHRAPSAIRTFDDVASGFAAARDEAGEADRIIVFGSFLTVAAALATAGPRTARAPRAWLIESPTTPISSSMK